MASARGRRRGGAALRRAGLRPDHRRGRAQARSCSTRRSAARSTCGWCATTVSPRAPRPRPTWSAAPCCAWPTATPRASPASARELCEMIMTCSTRASRRRCARSARSAKATSGPMADLAHGLLDRSGFVLAENEGLALVNSNAFTTAWACARARRRRPADGRARRGGRPGPGGVRGQPDQPAPGDRGDPAVPGAGVLPGAAARAAFRELPVARRARRGSCRTR